MDQILPLIIQLVAGLVGGHAAGAAVKTANMGAVGNSLSGLIGGGVLGQIMQALITGSSASGGLDLASIIASIGGGRRRRCAAYHTGRNHPQHGAQEELSTIRRVGPW